MPHFLNRLLVGFPCRVRRLPTLDATHAVANVTVCGLAKEVDTLVRHRFPAGAGSGRVVRVCFFDRL